MTKSGQDFTTAEHQRLAAADAGQEHWRHWGPYLSERQWGTVREDYSPDGSAWEYFPFDHAASRAYRWGEDGLAGWSDHLQRLCFALALWNGRDPILKERLFGLTCHEGNHGEDVKEVYYYLDATPTASYLKMLYKYPQAEFPYERLRQENRRRGRTDPEFELPDTGVFDAGRYWDVFIEFAKAAPEDVLIRIHAFNRGPERATLHVLPHLWFRNSWSWGQIHSPVSTACPALSRTGARTLQARHESLGQLYLHVQQEPTWLFTDNVTNTPRLFGTPAQEGHYYKDAFHQAVVAGRGDAVNPAHEGTKAAAWWQVTLDPGQEHIWRLRLGPAADAPDWEEFPRLFRQRLAEADAFHAALHRGLSQPQAQVQRQALAGLIWSKQFYYLDVPQWLEGDPAQPAPPPQRKTGRNHEWTHLNNAEVLSMPDKWEFPWYASWDLAFHTVPLALMDPVFAKQQLLLLTREWYMHPNGQLPAYEWSFGDVNPPLHAWAAFRVYQIEQQVHHRPGDTAFLETVLHKLLLNFTWWVNRKDLTGRNVFQGGFLGLDNIGVFDRSEPLPTGGYINQADGTSWMAMYCLNLMRIALELSLENPVYQDLASKFFEHFLYIAAAMTNIGGRDINLWNEEDGFFYDVLRLPDGRHIPLRLRSIVGLIPLLAVEVLDTELLQRVPEFTRRLEWFLNYRPDLAALVSRWNEPCKKGHGQQRETRLLSLLRGHRMKCLLKRMLNESEFLSPFGVRALSRYHLEHPFTFTLTDQSRIVRYEPGESQSGLFGGNSNWRGPVWMPLNYMLVDSLRRFHTYYTDEFKVEHPTGSGRLLSLAQIADELSGRLQRLFLPDAQGHRPVLAYSPLLQQDPQFKDYILFHEYYHGDTGRGVGASHQTGWSALVADLLRS